MPPGVSGGGSGGGAPAELRLGVRHGPCKFRTTVPGDVQVSWLKGRIESDFRSLWPDHEPLVVHALLDQDGYLLPDSVRVGDVVSFDDELQVVPPEHPGRQQPDEWGAARVVEHWRAWQAFAVRALAAGARHAPSRPALLQAGALDVLGLAALGADPAAREEAARAVARLSEGSAAALGTLAMLARAADDPEVLEAVAGGFAGASRAGLARAGADVAQGLARLAEEAPSRAAREQATEALCAVQLAAEGAARPAGAPAVVLNLPGDLPLSGGGGGAAGADDPVTDVRALLALLGEGGEESARVAARRLAQVAREPPVAAQLARSGGLAARACELALARRGDVHVCRGVAALLGLSAAASAEGRAAVQAARGACAALAALAVSDDRETREAAAAGLDAMARAAEGRAGLPVPLSRVVDMALSRFVGSTRVAASLLWRLSEDEEGGVDELGPFCAHLVRAASVVDEPTRLGLAQAIANVALREAHKRPLVAAGAAPLLASLLGAGEDAQMQRVAARALANLGSSAEDIREEVISALAHISFESVEDPTVQMYLELLLVRGDTLSYSLSSS